MANRCWCHFADFPELAAMLDQVMTDGMTVGELRVGAASPAPLNRVMVAVDDDGAIVGWSMLRRGENEPANRAFTSTIAHPNNRRAGIGSALFEDAVAHARSIGVTELKARVKDSEQGWLAWARSKGFEIDRHSFRSSVVLAEFDGAPFMSRIAELEARLERIERPIRIIVGSVDEFAPAGEYAEHLPAIAGLRLDVIPGANHFFSPVGLAELSNLLRD